jgi:hypothetical protein
MQQCNHLPDQVFFTENSALDLYSELCWLETESINDGFSQISGTLPCPIPSSPESEAFKVKL